MSSFDQHQRPPAQQASTASSQQASAVPTAAGGYQPGAPPFHPGATPFATEHHQQMQQHGQGHTSAAAAAAGQAAHSQQMNAPAPSGDGGPSTYHIPYSRHQSYGGTGPAAGGAQYPQGQAPSSAAGPRAVGAAGTGSKPSAYAPGQQPRMPPTSGMASAVSSSAYQVHPGVASGTGASSAAALQHRSISGQLYHSAGRPAGYQQQHLQHPVSTMPAPPVTISVNVGGTNFEVDPKFQIIKAIGQGAYGVVVSAINTQTGKKVAIKKIANAFHHLTDAKRTLREIKLLRYFNHENIISIDEILRPPCLAKFNDVYIISELMDTDLHQIVGSSQPLTDDHCQYFIYQILRGLKYIHSANVLHRDLKPSNILLNGNCDLKICDFGLARVANQSASPSISALTEYVATRWYRAPEIMLGWCPYTKAIDVWSVGCILVEILARRPLFPGRDYIHQLNLITELTGTPDESLIARVHNPRAQTFLRSLPPRNKMSLRDLLPNASDLAIDLAERMLNFDPAKRITVEDALRHPYLAALHDPTDEPEAPAIFDLDWDSVSKCVKSVRNQVFLEMLAFHPEAAEPGFDVASQTIGSTPVSQSSSSANIAAMGGAGVGRAPAPQHYPQHYSGTVPGAGGRTSMMSTPGTGATSYHPQQHQQQHQQQQQQQQQPSHHHHATGSHQYSRM
ncbi:CMGC/MAPK protein kinase [Fonticula alba]|uniref:Mitogen-activated protein kinase n=1 Tax=Fonticula alba TaxID=691883 RepID=A0A058ZBK5_FONAL|nr:CMGC/MAPK protein kinase [Fonticula alba]KCV71311.1 CMGC/MAPK protein kinase [Fonticula alba]|eukprot:XP_009494434.1 CMGC/MAPK protein kinase [Fonticula alba]